MTSERSSQDKHSQTLHSQGDSSHQSVTVHLYRFLGGMALGVVMVAVPYSVASIPFDVLHAGIAALFVLMCGTLASQFGPRFIETLSKLLADTGLY